MGDHKASPLYPGRETPTGRTIAQPAPHNLNEDDPLDHTGSVKSGQHNEHSQYIIAPSIQVRPEFPSLTRASDASQPLTCIVVIELPGKRVAGAVPGPIMSDNYRPRSATSRFGTNSGPTSPLSDHTSQQLHQRPCAESNPMSPPPSYQNRTLTSSHEQYSSSKRHDSHPHHLIIHHEEDSSFSAITEDLRNRIIDWKGHPLSDLGPLQMYDLLSVRRDAAIREFYVYLFKEAIICVVEEKKRGLGRLLSGASGLTDSISTVSSSNSRGVLRLKGRIYVRHIKNVTASSAAGEMSLTIDMEDELASFILIFKERSSMEPWKNNIQALVNMFQAQNARSQPSPEPARALNMEEFGGSSKVMRMLSGSTQTTTSTVDSLLNHSSRSTMSSSTSNGSTAQRHQMSHSNKLSPLGEDDELSTYDSPTTTLVTPHMSFGPSNSLTPLPHPPIDLILVVSIPSPTAVPSTAQLKVRVIKATLDFILASLSPRDRLSLVTFEVGPSGKVRKTPFLSLGKTQSRARLERFVDELGVRVEESQDGFLVKGSKDEKTDVVTAVNHSSCFCLWDRLTK
jgi:hypothetical protein